MYSKGFCKLGLRLLDDEMEKMSRLPNQEECDEADNKLKAILQEFCFNYDKFEEIEIALGELELEVMRGSYLIGLRHGLTLAGDNATTK
jgi:hypothetical protein